MASRKGSQQAASTSEHSVQRYRGVSLNAGRYRGRLTSQGTVIDVGRWPSAQEAAIALDRAILSLQAGLPLQVPELSRELGPRAPRLLKADARTANQNASSKYLGVRKLDNGWEAICSHAYVNYRARPYHTAKEAALARDRMALFYKGEGGERNFPNTALTPASQEDLRAELEAQKPRDSQYHGVHLASHVQQRCWLTMVYGPQQKSHFCGLWESEDDAALAHDRVALHLFRGRPPKQNFPERELEPATPTAMRREAVRQRKETTTSRYLGVYFAKGAWVAAITLPDGKTKYLGRFPNEEEAARERDRVAREHSGPRTKFNFPKKGER